MRRFEDTEAVRARVPVLIALMGASSSGKTFSALRLATGIQRVSGGDIHVIDTESRRALHYADRFKFRHVPFAAPFSPLDYLAAIEHCVSRGAKTIVIDSMSHEHEGPGGVLEMHSEEVERRSGGDHKKAQSVNMLCWAKPKAARRRLINTMTQLDANVILCFRAKEKIKPVTGKEPIDLGWMPIGGDEFVYEMTASCLLTPGCGGVPTWESQMPGEKTMIKLPEQYRDVFLRKHKSAPLSEDIGEIMAQWASGASASAHLPRTVPEGFRFPRGEHAGKTPSEVPLEYLQSLASNNKITGDARAAVLAEMERRASSKRGDAVDANSSPVDAILASIATMSSEELTMLALPNGLTADELASINSAIDERLAELASEKGDSQ